MSFPIRYIAQIIVEAETPLAIGSDSLLFDQDAPVEKDCNGLPYIPGTALAGFLRHKLNSLSSLFGEEPDSNSDQPLGSNFMTSDAYLLDSNYKVHQKPEIITDEFLLRYDNLPIRQHVAINAFGAAEDGSLFDQELVFKGSRFKFEIELQLAKKQDMEWKTILNVFFDNDFYIGGGQFNNFGELKVKEKIKEKCFDLNNDLDTYLNHTVDLNKKFDAKEYEYEVKEKFFAEKTLNLSGKDSFFHFGAGFGDIDVDNINYQEDIIIWENNKPDWKPRFVIPGTSIKGAIAHRLAYHYNKTNGNTIEKLVDEFKVTIESDYNKQFNLKNFVLGATQEELEQQKSAIDKVLKNINDEKFKMGKLLLKYTGTNNKGVIDLFGSAKSDEGNGDSGTIIIKDCYLDKKSTSEIIFMHNKIDRYTGGTVDTALFNEKVLSLSKVDLEIKGAKEAIENEYFKNALNDLKKGLLPVGGLINKGHGIFVEEKTA